MTSHILIVGLGGALGSILRYLCQRQWNNIFPYGTLMVNLLGCFLIGFLAGWLAKSGDAEKQLLLMTGFCGGFTTFSAFTQEGIQMLMDNRWLTFALYLSISVVAGFAATFCGFKIVN